MDRAEQDEATVAAGVPRALLQRTAAILGEGVVATPVELADLPDDEPVPEELYRVVWRQVAAAADGRTDFGLEAGRTLQRGAFHALEYVVRASETLADGIARLLRFQSVLTGEDYLSAAIADERVEIRLRSRFEGEVFEAFQIDLSLRAVSALLSDVTGGRARFGAHFRRSAPPDPSPYEPHFASVEWNATHDAIVLTADQLTLPMREADPTLCAIIENVVEEQITEGHAATTTWSRVQRTIAEHLAEAPSIDDVAEQLGTSVRTLQDRLAAEGTTFRELLDQTRLRFGVRYLEQPELSVSDVAYMLGYSDATAFGRAFKRWTGKSPGSFRRS